MVAAPPASGCGGPFIAKQPGEVPPPSRGHVLAGVVLPAGGQGQSGDYWVSHETVADPGRLWGDLAARFADTGLWPPVALVRPPLESHLLLVPVTRPADVVHHLRT